MTIRDLDQSDYEADGAAAAAAGYFSDADLSYMNSGQLREALHYAIENSLSPAYHLLLARLIVDRVADPDGPDADDILRSAYIDADQVVAPMINRFTGQDGVLTDADRAGIYGTGRTLAEIEGGDPRYGMPDDEPVKGLTVMRRDGAPPPVQAEPEELLTDLHKIAARARDVIVEAVGGYAFAFQYLYPYTSDSAEIIEARWIGLDQGIAIINRRRTPTFKDPS